MLNHVIINLFLTNYNNAIRIALREEDMRCEQRHEIFLLARRIYNIRLPAFDINTPYGGNFVFVSRGFNPQ